MAIVMFIEKIIGGSIDPPALPTEPVDLYVITTPKKRDDLDWPKEAARFGISTNPEASMGGITLIVDSWNNIKKHTKVQDAFFIFDEQRAIGSGVWSKSFIAIAKRNRWVMLSATPADRWMDLVPVFIAKGFYKNKTQFVREHVVYSPYTKYPSIRMYLDIPTLKRHRDETFVIMPFKRRTKTNIVDVPVMYDREATKLLKKTEWNPYKDYPIRNHPEYVHVLRRLIYSHASRISELIKIHIKAKRLIIFYNFNYELDIMREGFANLTEVSEHNGHNHDPVPTGDNWVYLVQYISGSEAWECFSTNHMAFYSANPSYRATIQAMGRINRMTTTYKNLYYYRLMSESAPDKGMMKSFGNKEDFNMRSINRK